MQVDDWHDATQRAFACRIDAAPGDAAPTSPGSGHLVLAFNPEPTPQPFTLPARDSGSWRSTAAGELPARVDVPRRTARLSSPARALVVLRATKSD